MRLPRLRTRTLMIAVAVAGVSLGGVLALVDRDLWMERRVRGLFMFEPWIASRLEWLYLGILASTTTCAVIALASGSRPRIHRLSTRRWLAVVAGVAVILAGVAALQRRSSRFRELARHHRSERDRVILSDLEIYLLMYLLPHETEPVMRFVNEQYRLEEEYEQASRRPWLFVRPGPSLPVPSQADQEALRLRGERVYQSLRRNDSPR